MTDNYKIVFYLRDKDQDKMSVAWHQIDLEIPADISEDQIRKKFSEAGSLIAEHLTEGFIKK